ncbi:MAG: tetratricopeptide repeat protein [Saprospiraceae bacterium]|nr:tetratricopeptide repeat protein [Saprospiraceae bacterium]
MNPILFFILLTLGLFSSCGRPAERVTAQDDRPAAGPVLCGPVNLVWVTEPGNDGSYVPLFEGLDVYEYPIQTGSEMAQKYFNQGLILAYGFNHAEAARSFRECARRDPECAMCYWGLAYVLGPNYNAGMDEEVLPMAREALAQANLLIDRAGQKEQGLIKALSKRYPPNKETEPTPYYAAYSEALGELSRQFPDDLDIAAMWAESIMDLHPWDLWERKTGLPKSWTPQITSILEGVLSRDSTHPAAAHFYIHAIEASLEPERGLPAADMLAERVPGAGHLVHMPSHIYIRTGHYHKGVLANERAVLVDSTYFTACHAAGVYPLGLYPHNWHFLAATAALEGQGIRAVEAAREVAYATDKERMLEPGWGTLQHYYSMPWHVMVKFAQWEEILNEPRPADSLKYPLAVWQYARGMALAGLNRLEEAEATLAVVDELLEDPAIEAITVWDLNNGRDLMQIGSYMLAGNIARQRGDLSEAVVLLEKAVAIEDRLAYNEPPDWFFPVRHLLGAVLLEQSDWSSAEKTYLEDLAEFPENGWALAGLAVALEKQGRKEEAKEVRARFKAAWQWADVPLSTSVL